MSVADTLEQYAINPSGGTSDPYKYQVTLKHVYADNCFVLDHITPTYFVFAGLWATLTIGFTAGLYLMPRESRLNLQKSIILFPGLKTLELVLEGLWLSYCPWVTMSSS